MRSFALSVLLLGVALAASAQMAPKRDCGAWDALIGTWDADPNPVSPGSTGWTSFERDLQGKVIVRKNHADYPATKDKPASVHDDLMVIYDDPAGQDRRAIYWDNEGHVIRYVASTSSGGCTLTLVTEPGTPGPGFRLTYVTRTADTLAGLFEIAPPNAPTLFKKYLEWTMHRRTAKTQ